MQFESVVKHLNDHHSENLADLCKKFGGVSEVKNVECVGVDFEGLNLKFDGKDLRIEFPRKASESTLKDTIIELCMSVKKTHDISAVKADLEAFLGEFGSVCLATLGENGEPVCTYAPLISHDSARYIYISEVSEHFSNIKNHPKNFEVMFLEDESKAASVILRKRARFRAEAEFIARESAEFSAALDSFERANGGGGGIKTIRKMEDFHLIKLNFGAGRFVKGFGQAYDIAKDGAITFAGASGNPHKMPHKA